MEPEKIALGVEDFNQSGRSLNLSGFTNLEKAVEPEADEKIEKGVMDELSNSYGETKGVKFFKTGEEIKDKVTVLLASISAKELECKVGMSVLLEKIGFMPSKTLDEWELRGLPLEGEFKRFSWDQCQYDERNNGNAAYLSKTSDGESLNTKTASCKEEADNCRSYNQKLEMMLNCYRDRIKAEAFIRNIDEKKTYELSLNLLTSLGF